MCNNSGTAGMVLMKFNADNVHYSTSTIYENDKQDAIVWDNLLFLGCSTCFKRYFWSSSGASKLHYSFWYCKRMSLPPGIMEVSFSVIIKSI
jgi:hypothetical protein